MMKSVIWWRNPEETTDLRQVTDETFHTYGLCPVRELNLGRSGVKQSELRRNESGALAHRATAVPIYIESMFHFLSSVFSMLAEDPKWTGATSLAVIGHIPVAFHHNWP